MELLNQDDHELTTSESVDHFSCPCDASAGSSPAINQTSNSTVKKTLPRISSKRRRAFIEFINHIKYTAKILSRKKWVKDFFHELNMLFSQFSSSVLSVELIGLGIGNFTHHNEIESFLQMSLFFCISCFLRMPSSFLLSDSTSSSVESIASIPLTTKDSGNFSPRIKLERCVVYDPIMTSDDIQCCEKLGFHVDSENFHGGYQRQFPNSALIMFMPHCSSIMYHNLLAANWPSPENTQGFIDLFGKQNPQNSFVCREILSIFQNIIILGNNLKKYDSLILRNILKLGKRNILQLLRPFMRTTLLFNSKLQRSGRNGSEMISYNNLKNAFFDLTLTSFSELENESITCSLLPRPVIVKLDFEIS